MKTEEMARELALIPYCCPENVTDKECYFRNYCYQDCWGKCAPTEIRKRWEEMEGNDERE